MVRNTGREVQNVLPCIGTERAISQWPAMARVTSVADRNVGLGWKGVKIERSMAEGF